MKEVPRKKYQQCIGISNSRRACNVGEYVTKGNDTIKWFISKYNCNFMAMNVNYRDFYVKG